MRYSSTLSLCALLWAGTLSAAQFDVSLQVPQLDVAEYHRPYVAAWIEGSDKTVFANLLVWYQQDKKGAPATAESGTKWLPDIRQWWRRTGRELTMPLDGVSSATRPVGEHTVKFQPGKAPLPSIPVGRYTLRVEASREEGGRELLEIPFEWPPAASQTLTTDGKSELGTVTLTVAP